MHISGFVPLTYVLQHAHFPVLLHYTTLSFVFNPLNIGTPTRQQNRLTVGSCYHRRKSAFFVSLSCYFAVKHWLVPEVPFQIYQSEELWWSCFNCYFNTVKITYWGNTTRGRSKSLSILLCHWLRGQENTILQNPGIVTLKYLFHFPFLTLDINKLVCVDRLCR